MSLTLFLTILTRPLRRLLNRGLLCKEIKADLDAAKAVANKRLKRATKANTKALDLNDAAIDYLYERRRSIRDEASALESLAINLNFRS